MYFIKITQDQEVPKIQQEIEEARQEAARSADALARAEGMDALRAALTRDGQLTSTEAILLSVVEEIRHMRQDLRFMLVALVALGVARSEAFVTLSYRVPAAKWEASEADARRAVSSFELLLSVRRGAMSSGSRPRGRGRRARSSRRDRRSNPTGRSGPKSP